MYIILQAGLEKLYSMKQDLLNAEHQCSNVDSAERDKMVENVKSDVLVLAGLVNSELSTSINQVSMVGSIAKKKNRKFFE